MFLEFGILVSWVNTWGLFFSFFENFFFGHGLGPKMTKNFGAAWRSQKLSDVSEIWYTCFLSKYLGFFFSFFENFYFRARGSVSVLKWPKTSGQPGGPKHCEIFLKFGIYTCFLSKNLGVFFFSFFENFNFWAWGRSHSQNDLKLWDSLEVLTWVNTWG